MRYSPSEQPPKRLFERGSTDRPDRSGGCESRPQVNRNWEWRTPGDFTLYDWGDVLTRLVTVPSVDPGLTVSTSPSMEVSGLSRHDIRASSQGVSSSRCSQRSCARLSEEAASGAFPRGERFD